MSIHPSFLSNCFLPFAPLLPFFTLLLPTSTLSHYVLSFTNSRQYYSLILDCEESPSNGANRWVPHHFVLPPKSECQEFTLPGYEHEQPEESGGSESSSSTHGGEEISRFKRKRGVYKTLWSDDEDDGSLTSESSQSSPKASSLTNGEETEDEESKASSSTDGKSSSELPVNRQQATFLPSRFKVNCDIKTGLPSDTCWLKVFDPYGNPYPKGQEKGEVWPRFDWELRLASSIKQFYLKDPEGKFHQVFGWTTDTQWPLSGDNLTGWVYRKNKALVS